MTTIPIDLSSVITTLIGAILVYFVKENTSEKKEAKKAIQDLREEVIILKTQIEPIKNMVYKTPILEASQDKMQKDLQQYYSELKKVKGLLSDKGFEL